MVHEGRQGFVDASIEYFTGMLEGMKTMLGFTEADDATVLTTGRHIDGSQADGVDYAAASIGIFLPVSGKAIAKLSGKGEGAVPTTTVALKPNLTDLSGT